MLNYSSLILILGTIRFSLEKDLVVARCLYLLCQPFKDNRGSSVINFLLNYGFHDLSDSDKQFWMKHADILISFLDCKYNIICLIHRQ